MPGYRTFLLCLVCVTSTTCDFEDEETMQVTLLQSNLQLHLHQQQGTSLGSFLQRVDLLEARVQSLAARVDAKATSMRAAERSGTRTPWLFQPFEAIWSLVRKLGDLLGDLVLHPRARAWQQLLGFCVSTAGVVSSGMALNLRPIEVSRMPCMALALMVGVLSLALAGAVCHPFIPWLLLFLLIGLAQMPQRKVDIVSDFVSDTVTGIAGGVHDMLNFATGSEEAPQAPESHLVKIVVAELIGAEKTLGLRIENRVITAFTKPEAVRFGWRLGDCLVVLGRQRVASQEALLAGIAAAKEALRSNGNPMEFLVERLGARPA
ncbi:unnamed protein product [Effrenium voratum]|uniref:PDZ domain-containing protein n=1 Tax=Effrenium voratum TaxID=2562239 RepID=A0AA36I0G2_9DINO|nr:unnamed protein product [Effrenium voratum]